MITAYEEELSKINSEIRKKEIHKPNILIQSAKSQSLKAMKILDYALTKFDPFKPVPENMGLVVEMNVKEIRALLGIKGNSIYTYLKNDIVVNIEKNNSYFYANDEEEEVGFFVLVERCYYKDGVLQIRFSPTASQMLTEVQKSKVGFTSLHLANKLNLESPHTYNIYELLRSKVYNIERRTKDQHVVYECGLEEFKFITGIYNMNSPDSRKAVIAHKNGERNYEKLCSMLGDNIPYSKLSAFKEYVLDRAKKEIKEYTDIKFEYDLIKTGRKVTSIKFYIFKNANDNIKKTIEKVTAITSAKTEDERKDAVIDYILDLFKETPIKASEARKIATEANFEVPIIEEAFDMAKNSTTPISNIVGWMISCIRDKWYNTDFPADEYTDKKEEEIVDVIDYEEVIEFDDIVEER